MWVRTISPNGWPPSWINLGFAEQIFVDKVKFVADQKEIMEYQVKASVRGAEFILFATDNYQEAERFIKALLDKELIPTEPISYIVKNW